MIIVHECLEVPVLAPFVEHDQVIQAFSTDSTDDPLNVSTLPRGTRRRQHLFEPIALTCFTNSWPKIRSRSRSRYRGTVSHGKASRIL